MPENDRSKLVDALLYLVRSVCPLPEPEPPAPPPSQEFSRFRWPGVKGRDFVLSRVQLAVVQTMVEAYLDGSPVVREEFLVGVARSGGSKALRLREVFRSSDAWGVLVVAGPLPGTCRLPEVPE